MARKELGPATLEVVRAVRAVVGDRPLLVAVSGGADSTALAWAVARVGRERGLCSAAVTVDHGLQPRSADSADRVVEVMTSLGFADVVVRRVRVAATGAGPEADARAARYRALDAEADARSADLLLGHTLDDQAETVLLGLGRGSGTRSLAGMAPQSGHRLRPLLTVRRDRTRQACAELGLPVWQDPHNTDPRFTRSRIRHRVLPVLEAELGPGIAEALARTARLARADADLLDACAGRLRRRAEQDGSLDCATLADAEPALRSRVVKVWLRERGATEVSAERIGAVQALVTDWHGQQDLQLPGLLVRRLAGRLIAVPQ